jgi:hypothetical protein
MQPLAALSTSDPQNFWLARPESSTTVGATVVVAIIEVTPLSVKAVAVGAFSDRAVVGVLDECRQGAHQKEGKTKVAPT